jgi:pyrrolidone-carboxylate peptidase
VFDEAADVLKKCFEKFKQEGIRPAIVLSLGENPACKIYIETRFFDFDYCKYGRDNNGVVRKEFPFGLVRPAVKTTLNLKKMFCGLSSENREKIAFSNYAGGFVCNNLGYQAGRYFIDQKPSVPYGFFHLPSDKDCGATWSTTTNKAEPIADLLQAAFDEIPSPFPGAAEADPRCRS